MNTLMRLTGVIGILLLAESCVPSYQPLYTGKNLTVDSRLLGRWSEADGKEIWTFEQVGHAGHVAYDVTYSDGGPPAKFEGHLVRLGKFLFLDLYPEPAKFGNEVYGGHFLRMHTFARIWLDGGFRFSALDPDWLDKHAAKIGIAHLRRGDELILTASTAELQNFMLAHAENPAAFHPVEMHRR